MANNEFLPMGTSMALEEAEKTGAIAKMLTRTHYFDGRLLTARDLTRDQQYLMNRMLMSGRSLGRGVVRGLELSLDVTRQEISVSPGVGVTESGHILETPEDAPMTLDLNDRDWISALNNGRFYLNAGLYVVMLRYSETARGIAEVYPTELSQAGPVRADHFLEGVELQLLPLAEPMPLKDPAPARAALAGALVASGRSMPGLPADAVALGVIAVHRDQAVWADPHLVREQQRWSLDPFQYVKQLALFHDHLMEDLLADRTAAGLDGGFSADAYFSILPPCGRLPKSAVDPLNARQYFFRNNGKVSILPVNREEWPALRDRAMNLPPLDAHDMARAEVVIVAALTADRFAARTQPLLTRSQGVQVGHLPHLGVLELQLHHHLMPAVVLTDIQKDFWSGVWNGLESDQVFYLRRRADVGANELGAIVLAGGYTHTEPQAPPYVDGCSIFLDKLNFKLLKLLRCPLHKKAKEAFDRLAKKLGDSAEAVCLITQILLVFDKSYDPVLWPTIEHLVKKKGAVLGASPPTLSEMAAMLGTGRSASSSARASLPEEMEKLGRLPFLSLFISKRMKDGDAATSPARMILEDWKKLGLTKNLLGKWKKAVETAEKT